MKEADNKYRTLLRRTVISQIAILVILLTSRIGYVTLSAQKPGVQSKEVVVSPLNIDTFTVIPVKFREIITAYGTAAADLEAVVAAQVSGQIVDVHPKLEVGQHVTAKHTLISADEPTQFVEGHVLVHIDDRDYVNRARQLRNRISETTRELEQLRQQQVNSRRLLEKSQTDVFTFQQEYDRFRRAVDLNAGAESEMNRALVDLNRQKDTIIQLSNQVSLFPLQIAAAKERLSSAQAEFQQAEDNLERTRVLPPFDGVLSEVMTERGQYIRAGEPLFRLTSPDNIDIPVAIGLEDWRQIAASVNAGKQPTVHVATSESAAAEWTGTIGRVAPEADPGTRTILVFVNVVNDDRNNALLPGTFVQARITGDEHEGIIIPRTAILNDHVFVVGSDHKVRRQKITQGRRLKSLVVVSTGLNGSEQIATTNLTLLENGQNIEVQTTTDLTGELQTLQNSVVELLSTMPQERSLEASHDAPVSDAILE
ncbi:MAG: efflux RND transporter periplasmic adaptor subunit [Fuerstiella sp.]|nr:efflux RND transporter periplasmic adaptor subunit [Fuerstiella sp.]